MAHHHHSVKVIEQCAISPPPGSVPSTSLPLTLFDFPWFYFLPVQRIFFYEFPHPTHHFLQTVLPALKHSLSLTLQHFFPFAANLVVPLQPRLPYFLYSHGDSVSFTVAESTQDFHHFVADTTARDAREFHPFTPVLPSPLTSQDGAKLFPLMAIQVTVLSNFGFSICISFRHVVADGRAFHHFMKFWASVCRTRGDIDPLEGSLLFPLHNRDIIEDPKGLKLIFLEKLWNSFPEIVEFKGNVHNDVLADKVRLTFVLSRDHVEKIKKWVSLECKSYGLELESLHISTFVVTCSLMWVCKVKSEDANINTAPNNDEIYKLVFAADCRNCPELSIPTTYFGNCLAARAVELNKSKLVGENGIVEAAIAIESNVRDFKCEGLKGIESMMSDSKEAAKRGQNTVIVAGSPRLGVYETNFGWGKPKRSDVLHMKSSGSFALSDSRDNDGGVEVGLTLVRSQMNNFNTILKEHLRNIVGRD